MRKNQLIKYLEEIEGNPEILFYNPLVDDWQKLSVPQKDRLVKMQKDYYIKAVQNESAIKNNDPAFNFSDSKLKQLQDKYKAMEYEFNEFVTKEDIANKDYKTKTVVFLQAKKDETKRVLIGTKELIIKQGFNMKNHPRFLFERKFPRTMLEAFPNSPEYASSIEVYKPKQSYHSNKLLLVGAVLLVFSAMMWFS